MTTHTLVRPVWLSPTRLILWVLVLLGATVAGIRYVYGIGAISNLNNVYSFGLWISLDLLCGVALAAGGFTCCAAFYIFGRKDLQPLTRPAVLTGFLGYLAVIFALLVDLGHPERIWYFALYQNFHSPLFEVGTCVVLYTTVLFLEFSPMLFEWLGWKKFEHAVHTITLPIVILGVVLSTLHQSSLGSLFLVMSDKLHPLWHSPILPLFFFISAATVGLAMVIFEATISAHAYGRAPETRLLGKIAKPIPWMLGTYLALKIGELWISGDLPLLFAGDRAALFFWLELGWGVILPMLLFAIPAVRRSQAWLFTGALMVVTGLVLNRFDVGLLMWNRPAGSWYVPSWMEFAVSFGVIAALVLAYDWVARHLRLFEEGGDHA
jgi:Ni/Fe-hydrogenase subunit HybB-like protein